MPGVSAAPKNRAEGDHRKAAVVPMEMSVSYVVVPCLELVPAAWWDGQTAQAITGTVMAEELSLNSKAAEARAIITSRCCCITDAIPSVAFQISTQTITMARRPIMS